MPNALTYVSVCIATCCSNSQGQSYVMLVTTKCSNQLIKPLHIVHQLRDAQCWVCASNVFILNHLLPRNFAEFVGKFPDVRVRLLVNLHSGYFVAMVRCERLACRRGWWGTKQKENKHSNTLQSSTALFKSANFVYVIIQSLINSEWQFNFNLERLSILLFLPILIL